MTIPPENLLPRDVMYEIISRSGLIKDPISKEWTNLQRKAYRGGITISEISGSRFLFDNDKFIYLNLSKIEIYVLRNLSSREEFLLRLLGKTVKEIIIRMN